MACKFGEKIALSSLITGCNHSWTSLGFFKQNLKFWRQIQLFSPGREDGSQVLEFVYIFQVQIGCASISKEHSQGEQGEGRSQNPSQISI